MSNYGGAMPHGMLQMMQNKGKNSAKKLPLIQSDDSPMKVVQKDSLDVKQLI